MPKVYTVYKTTNLVNGLYYIGMHKTSDPNDSYLGSGLELRQAIQQFGVESFKKEIVAILETRGAASKLEADLVTPELVASGLVYNKTPGGCGGWAYYNRQNPGQAAKASEAAKLKRADPVFMSQFRLTVSDGVRRRYANDPDLIERHRKAQAGNRHRSFLGRKHTPQAKAAIGAKNATAVRGSKNGAHGCVWLHSVEQRQSKRVPSSEVPKFVQVGWVIGRKLKF